MKKKEYPPRPKQPLKSKLSAVPGSSKAGMGFPTASASNADAELDVKETEWEELLSNTSTNSEDN